LATGVTLHIGKQGGGFGTKELFLLVAMLAPPGGVEFSTAVAEVFGEGDFGGARGCGNG